MRALLGITLSAMMAFPAFASSAWAKVTEKDTLVIARIIGMLQNMPKGEVLVAAVSDGAASTDADSFVQLAGSGKQVGNTTMRAIKVTVEESYSTPAKILLVPEGLDPAQLDRVFEAAKKRKLVTISTSDAYVDAKQCAIGIKTEPAVDIKMSASAAAATGVSFGSTMRMMIKEVP